MRSAGPELRVHNIACTSVYLGLVHTRMSAPTESYRTAPGMTADEAARVICGALVRRPHHIQPWWLGPLRVLAPWCEPLVDWLFFLRLRHLRREPASPAPKDPSP